MSVFAVYQQPADVEARLGALGVRREHLHHACMVGALNRASTTTLHPTSFGGYTAWANTTAALREQLLPLGWRVENAANFELTVSPDAATAIVVATGDEGTGLPFGSPRTRAPKGPAMRQIVMENYEQLSLGLNLPEPSEPVGGPVVFNGQTWVLLLSYATPGRLRAELSLPLYFEGAHVQRWLERILLAEIDLDGGALSVPVAPELGPDFDVVVVPKVG
jgi:hypothetical protein